MPPTSFKSVAVSGELNLTAIASHFGIERRLSWEDTLVLTERHLGGLLPQPAGKGVFVFSFGTLVFVNCASTDVMDVISYFKKLDKNLADFKWVEYTDDYRLVVDSAAAEVDVGYDEMVVPSEEPYYLEIIAVALAKSTALDRIEDGLSNIFDNVEVFISQLKKGNLNISDEARSPLRPYPELSVRSISYIMLLDRPDVVWRSAEAASVYSDLEHLFELPDRYEKITHKTETLLDIIEVFADLYHAKRGTRLEWAVIILFIFEIVLTLVESIWPF